MESHLRIPLCYSFFHSFQLRNQKQLNTASKSLSIYMITHPLLSHYFQGLHSNTNQITIFTTAYIKWYYEI